MSKFDSILAANAIRPCSTCGQLNCDELHLIDPPNEPILGIGHGDHSKHIPYMLSLLTRNYHYNPPINFTDSSGRFRRGHLMSVQREDGSGRSFNLTIGTPQHTTETFHLRFTE